MQGLIKIEETNIEVLARAEDKAIVARVLPEAVNEFRALMTAAGHTGSRVNVSAKMSDIALPSKSW